MGAPAMAFCRLDERDIRLGEPVVGPDALIIQDSTLLQQVNLFKVLDHAATCWIVPVNPVQD